MTKKSISFDAMVNQSYTKAIGTRSGDLKARIKSGRLGMNASDYILEFIKETGDDVDIGYLKYRWGYGRYRREIHGIWFRKSCKHGYRQKTKNRVAE